MSPQILKDKKLLYICNFTHILRVFLIENLNENEEEEDS